MPRIQIRSNGTNANGRPARVPPPAQLARGQRGIGARMRQPMCYGRAWEAVDPDTLTLICRDCGRPFPARADWHPICCDCWEAARRRHWQ
jgi:hypothetical protein